MPHARPANDRFDEGYDVALTGCWQWRRAKPNTYGNMRVNGRMTGAHRFSYQRFIGPLSEDALVCHSCDNPACVNPAHLFVGSQTDNMQDMLSKGRGARASGERHGKSYLTEYEVAEIKSLIGTMRPGLIAKRFNTNYATVTNIRTGKTWKHVAPAHIIARLEE